MIGEVIYVDFVNKRKIDAPKRDTLPFADAETANQERAAYFKSKFTKLFEDGAKTRVVLFTKDAEIPDYLKSQELVALDFSVRFGLTDLQYGDTLSATLSFGGKPHPVVIPWTAVYAVMEIK